LGELIAGRSAYVDGTYVWTDYVYDDHGPNRQTPQDRDASDPVDSATAGGDESYPPQAAPGNAADLVQLQIGLRDRAIVVRAILETLVDPDLPVLALGFDTDTDSSTGADSFPGRAWPARGSLGIEVLVVIRARGAELWRHSENEWTIDGPPFVAVVDVDTNLIESTIPRERLDPRHQVWRAFGALGISDGDLSWLDGTGPIYDLAFVGNELLLRWQEDDQADILAGAVESRHAAATIDFARIAARDDERPGLDPGFHTFLYHSTLELPEGISVDNQGNRTFLGPYQPYAVFVPEDMSAPAPLAVFLHGLSQNHLSSTFLGENFLGSSRALSEDPFVLFPTFGQDGFDFPPATLQVQPLARGQALSYRGIAHQDVLDVLADVSRRFDIDPDRVTLQGASMGGIGTYRIGALNPDLWSAIVPLIGFQPLPLSENLFNLPVRQINGVEDPLIGEATATASAARLDELGYDYRYWLIDGRGHEAIGFIYDCVFHEVAILRREPNPSRVVYSVDPANDQIDAAIGLELRFDSAYWVSQIRVRDATALGTVNATSLALPRFDQTIVRIDERRDNIDQGADLCGTNPEVRTQETWRERGIDVISSEELPTSNALTIELSNVAAATFDLSRAGIDVTREASIAVTTDGATSVTLTGLRRGQTIHTAATTATAGPEGNATIDAPAGEHEVMLGSE
jgi:predicted esterase